VCLHIRVIWMTFCSISARGTAQIKMRVQQIWHWLYVRGVSDFADMFNISKDLRATLSQHFTIQRPEIVEEQISADGTRKWLFRFPPRGAGQAGRDRDSLHPRRRPRHALHLSQVGCTLTCSFCHTGTQKLVRNLTAEEILSQLLSPATGSAISPTATRRTARCALRRPLVSNIVMMGMGEPLYNFDNVKTRC
jgi:23S rRNA (adenine2503-C2)-methyltransferase